MSESRSATWWDNKGPKGWGKQRALPSYPGGGWNSQAGGGGGWNNSGGAKGDQGNRGAWRKENDDGNRGGPMVDVSKRLGSMLEMMEYKEWRDFEVEEKKGQVEKEKKEREQKEWEAEQQKKEREQFREDMKKDQETFFSKAQHQAKKRKQLEEEEEEEEEMDYKEALRAAAKKKAQAVAPPVDVEVWKSWSCDAANAKVVAKEFQGVVAKDIKGLSLIELGEVVQERMGPKAKVVAEYKKVLLKEPLARWAKLDMVLALLAHHCEE